MGASGPIVFEAAAKDGSWTLLCQPRSDTNSDGRLAVTVSPRGELGGDDLTRFVALSSGREHAVEDLLVRSNDDRRLLVLRGGELAMIRDEQVFELPLPGSDTRFEPGARSGHRTLAILGANLLYVRISNGQSEFVVRDLQSGSERVEHTSPEAIVRFEVYDAGALVVLQTASVDSNGNGRFDWPFIPSSKPRQCASPIPRFRARPLNADQPGKVVLDRRTGQARRVDDLVLPFGAALIRRGGEGTLVLDRNGQARVLADKNCAGRILWADPTRDQILLGCATPKRPGRLLVELVHETGRIPLDIDVAALSFDEPLGEPRRLVALYPGADAVLFDLERRQLHRLRAGDAVLHSVGSRAVVRRGLSLYVFDTETAVETPLNGKLDPFAGVLTQGDLVYAGPLLVDARSGSSIGSVPGPGLSLTPFGAVLTPETRASAISLAIGPLRWRMPIATQQTEPNQASR